MSSGTPARPAVPRLVRRGDVADLLGVPARQLTWWIWALLPHRRYDRFEISRRNGGPPRVIHAPIKPLKDLQRGLAEILLDVYEPRVHVHGFVRGRSPTTNAQQHQRQHWILKFDLEDFFPSINFGRVRGLFMAYPFEYPGDVATTLAQLCCHRNELPQGAPTSPIVSNFICRSLDAELGRLARAERCRYTRYADDICISTSRTEFPSSLATIRSGGEVRLSEQLTALVRRQGFRINPEKTRLLRRSRRQRVTGLVVNRKANVPIEYVQSVRNLLYIWKRYGEAEAAEALVRHELPRNRPPAKGAVAFKPLVRGRVQYIGSVKGWSNPTYRKLALLLSTLDPEFHPRTLFFLETVQLVRIYTEGPTDPKHLAAALRFFHERGEFTNLEFEIPDDASADGDTKLLAKSEELAQSEQATPCVCVFDRDNDDIIPRAVGSTNTRVRGVNVANAVIAPPEWRGHRVCTEMLYPDSDLRRRDDAGRRLYLSEEFDSLTGQHQDEDVHVPNPDRNRQAKKLVREDVYRFGTRESVGLSKMAFADNVEAGIQNFEGMDFEGFRRTLEIVEEAVVRMVGSP
jgi:RNA-directed DNA polymerase